MNRRSGPGSASNSTPRRWWCDVPSILLAIVVVTSPMAIGGVHAVSAAAVGAIAIAGLWWSIATTSDTSAQTPGAVLSIPALGCAAMALLCLIQLIPVPTSVYRLLQPAGWEALSTNWEVVYGESFSGRWHLLSLDPRQSSAHALRWIALAATAALAAQVITRRKGRRRWLGLILISATVVAIAGAAQYLSGTEDILGVYEAQITARSIAPFVNTNHAASYFGLMALVAIAFSLDHLRRSPLKTTLGSVAATAAIILCAAHGSDGALLALVVGIGLVAITVVTRTTPTEDSQKRRRFITLTALGVFFCGAVAFFMMPDDWTVADDEHSVLEETSAEFRLHMAGAALDAATDHPVVGSGAGSVERVLPPYIDWHYAGASTIPTVENEPAEWAMTLGPVALLIAFGAFALIAFRAAPHLWRRKGRRGGAFAFTLTVFFAIIALFHFPFATLGLSIPFVVAVEACLSQRRDGLHRPGSRRALAIFALGLTVALAGLMAARSTVLDAGPEHHHEVDDPDATERALHLYPTDGVLMSVKALNARGDDDERPLALARRAFELRPHPQQEFLLAGSLAAAGQSEEAAQVYQSLLHHERNNYRRVYGWAEPRLRFDLRTPELRATALADSSVTIWRRFFRHLEDEEGIMSAIDVALELVELRPNEARTHLELIALYRDAEQDELAEMYARTLVARNLDDAEGRNPAGLLTLIDILRDRDRHSTQALNIADRAFAQGHTFPELGRAVLRLLPGDVAAVSEKHHRVFRTALDVGCQSPYEESWRHLCWRGHAFVAEIDGELERAENYLRRLANLRDDPRRLAAFYARHERCRDIAALRRQFRDTRYERHIEREAESCARRWELD